MAEMILRRIALQCEYDPDGDTAHIHVGDPAAASGPTHTHTCPLDDLGGRVDLHFDPDGRLVRIEVADANRRLPDSLLKALSG